MDSSVQASTDLTHATRAEVSLAAFRHNIDAVRRYVGPTVGIMAVVKAGAYGHGAVRMAREALAHGVRRLAVARIHEGFELRSAGIDAPLLVFENLEPSHVQPALENDLELTIANDAAAERIAHAASKHGRRAAVHVKIDTGMGRLGYYGITSAAPLERIARMRSLDLVGVYSHFATSEDPDQSFARAQLGRFEGIMDDLRKRGIEVPIRHMANSGAIIALPDAHFDLVRPGIMLYGYPPAHGMVERHPVKPVMRILSRVSFVKSVDAGTSISYGRRYVTDRRTTIATLPIGYADGFSRILTHRASVSIRGVRRPVVGTVCMDHVMVDCGPGSDVSEGDEVTILGRDGGVLITGWDLALQAGTIPYEITCAVSPRVPRVYAE